MHIGKVMKMKIGIDIGGSHVAIAVVNDNGEIVEKSEKRLTSVEKENIEKSIEEYILECANKLMKKYDITQVGMSIPGWAENGVVITSGNLGIKNYPIIERLQEINLPIKIQNDAKCAAIAENKYGCLKGYNRSIFLTLGTGIGGAAFIDGQLLNAGKKPGYEFGHMVIEKDGIPCNCGKKGCFERYASMKAFKNNLRYALNLDETTRGEELLELIRKNNVENRNYEIIEKILSEYIENLSIGIQNLIEIFEPEVIGIGGSFVYFEDVLLPRLKCTIEKVNEGIIGRENIKIKTAILGNDAGMVGATL
jgi:glucokinase